jgi:hypothetical protein
MALKNSIFFNAFNDYKQLMKPINCCRIGVFIDFSGEFDASVVKDI